MGLSPVSPGSTLSNSLFIFPLLITKTTLFWGLLYNPTNPIFSICLSLQSSIAAILFSPFPLQSFSSSPSLSFYHSVMPPFLSLSITPPFLSLYHTASVHFFAGMLLRCSFCFFFFIFLVLCLLLCLVLGVWVVRKCGKANGFFGFVNFFFFVCFLRK